MAAVMFYEKPVLLNREAHKAKKIALSSSFSFAQKANSLYLAGVEFVEACKEYPIVFTHVAGKKIVPVAMLGLREGENLFDLKAKFLQPLYGFELMDKDVKIPFVVLDRKSVV